MTFVRTRLGGVSHYLQRGKSPVYSEQGLVSVINQKCVRWHGFDLQHARYIDNSMAAKLDAVRFLRHGDVVVNSTGEGTIGRANVWGREEIGKWVADSHVTVIRPTSSLDSYWLRYWLESQSGG